MKKFHLAVTAALVASAFGFSAIASVPRNDSVTVEELNNNLLDLKTQCQNLIARADAEKRDMTTEETAEFAALQAQFKNVLADIDRRQVMDEITNIVAEPAGRRTAAVVATPAAEAPGAEPARIERLQPGLRASVAATARTTDAGKWGFRTSADYLNAVMKSSARSAAIDPRLIANALTTTGNEGVGADGGFAVPPDFRATIIAKVLGEDSLLARTDQMTSSSNSMTVPIDETAPWDASGGIQAYWESEAGQKTQSKPALGEVSIKLNKVIVLVPLTDELLEDAPAMASYVNGRAPDKINYKVNAAIINGTGVGQPLGILNSDGTVIVPAEAGQAADTVVFNNVINMYSRLYAPAQNRAIWLANQDVLPQLMKMQFGTTGTAVPAYLPPGGLSGSPYATLMGRPIISSEAMPALGDQGDLILADMSQYLSITKGGGIKQDVSIHVFFDYDVTAFRFVLRVGGQPWWNKAIARPNGQPSRGFFVALGPR